MAAQKQISLTNGAHIHCLGLGTWKSKPDEVYNAVKHALKVGYRHIDCAWVYGNEEEVGRALDEYFKSPDAVPRDQIFVTTKLWNSFHETKDVKPALQQSLKKLKLDYVDLYLVHWPVALVSGEDPFPKGEDGQFKFSKTTLEETWRGMEGVLKDGLTKAIGISNYNMRQVKECLSYATVKPAMLQIENHPYLQQQELVDFCHRSGIAVTAYSPLGSPDRPWDTANDPKLLEDPVVLELAKKYNKNAGQILIRFQIDRGLVVIPKSANPERIQSNSEVFDFQLDQEDMKKLKGLDRNFRYIKAEENKGSPEYPF